MSKSHINIVINVHVDHGADAVQIVLMKILNLPTTDVRILLTTSGKFRIYNEMQANKIYYLRECS